MMVESFSFLIVGYAAFRGNIRFFFGGAKHIEKFAVFGEDRKLMQDFNLLRLIENVLVHMAPRVREKSLKLSWYTEPDVPVLLRGMPGILAQTLSNLVENALRNISQGEIEVGCLLEEREHTSARIRFSVKDTKKCLTQEHLTLLSSNSRQKTFSPSDPYDGDRYGLLLCREFLEVMGSSLEGRNLPGGGRQFWFTLSLEVQDSEGIPLFPVPENLRNVRTLIVDDNPRFRSHLKDTLVSWGMRPLERENPLEVLQELYLGLKEKDPFQLAILDMEMPAMNGDVLGEIIRSDSHFTELPLVLLSSGEYRKTDGAFLTVLPKPLRYDVFCAELSLAIEIKSGFFHSCRQIRKKAFHVSIAEKEVPSGVFKKENSQKATIPSFEGKTILVTEDNRINREVVLKMLQKTGARVLLAGDGREAVQAVEREVPDLVLMDLHMPHMDGFEAARILGNGYTDLPIVALSAAVTKDDLERTAALGMKAHLSKPINREILYEVLGKWLFSKGVRSVSSEITEWPRELPKDLPGFDLSLGLARFDGAGGAYRSALEDFFENLAQEYASVLLFLKEQERKKAEEILHVLKGVAGTLGAVALQQVVQAVEETLKKFGEVPLQMRKNLEETLAQVLEARKMLPPLQEKIVEISENQGREVLEVLRGRLEKSEFVEEELLRKALSFLNERAEEKDVEKFRKLVHSFQMEEALVLLKNYFP